LEKGKKEASAENRQATGENKMELKLKSENRTLRKKNGSARLRRDGFIPANLITDGVSNLITVPETDFVKLLNSGLRQSSVIELETESGVNKVLVKEIQRNPVSGKILHVDFFTARPQKKVRVKIGIELTGTAKGVKKGGALEHYIRVIKVIATPESLVDVLNFDITDLDVGDAVHLNDLQLHSDWDIKIAGNPIVAKIAKSRLVAAGGAEEAAGEEKK